MLNSLILSIANVAKVEENGENRVQSLLASDLGAPLPLHVSLSRPIGFLTDQKEPFLTSLTHYLKACGVRPFTVAPCGLDWVPNFEKTRWFLVLRLSKPEADSLNKLLKATNRVVEDHGQMPLYADAPSTVAPPSQPSRTSKPRLGRHDRTAGLKCDARDFSGFFHISIGWTLEQPGRKIIDATRAFHSHGSFREIQKMPILVNEVKAKIGNIVTSVEFPLTTVEEKGILGS